MTGPSKEDLVGGRPISLDVPGSDSDPQRPHHIRHITTPAYETPLRHHRRKPSTPREVKETLHARSEWSNSGDDGSSVHRINQYMIKEEIGRGSFGAVHLAVDHFGNEYAVKEFSKSRLRKRAQSHILRRSHARPGSGKPWSPGSFGARLSPRPSDDESQTNPLFLIREEIAIMKKLNHPNLVSLLEVLDDPEEDSLYMVLEMCKKGVIMKVGMHEPADPYDDESCRCWFRDLILGIEYLHAQGVAHRDIKPDNLLLTEDDELKIVDFGVSEIFEKSSDALSTKSAGSPAFLPPELCVTKHGNVSGKAADIWSMGVTLYCLAFGHVPFEKTNILELYKSITNDDLLLADGISPDFRDLMCQLLEKDPEKRIQMPELRSHPWVTRSGAEPLISTEENVSHVVSPPTHEELDRAITKNMRNLLVVVKAVKQFKRLLHKRRPGLFDSILGSSARIVQPPGQMDDRSQVDADLKEPSKYKLHLQTRSQDAWDRMPVEGALATEGLHRGYSARDVETGTEERESGAVVMSPGVMEGVEQENKRPRGPESGLSDSSLTTTEPLTHTQSAPAMAGGDSGPEMHHHRTGTAHEGKGQAHDPLTDTIFLGIGASGTDDSGIPADSTAISESPMADESNIYEKAYEQEIERIRRERGRNATFYLTRRVDMIRDQLEGEWAGLGQQVRSATVGSEKFQGMMAKAKAKAEELEAGEGQGPSEKFQGMLAKAKAKAKVGESQAHERNEQRERGPQAQKLADAAGTMKEAGQQAGNRMADALSKLRGKTGRS